MKAQDDQLIMAGRRRAPPESGRSPAHAAAGPQPGPARARVYALVLANGDRRERERWEAHLADPDYRIVSVEDGHAALQAVKAGRIDVVVAAISMARLDGIELLRSLEDEGQPAVILVAKSGDEPDRIFLKVAKLYGAAATFSQPVDGESLRQAVRNALGLGDIDLV